MAKVFVLFVGLLSVLATSGSDISLSTFKDAKYGFPNGRIVGGHDAEIHSAPWIISIQFIRNTSQHICGGSIIGSEWVMTAAHCLVGLPPGGRLEVSAGRHNISLATEVTEQRRRVDRFYVHEDYSGGVGPFDIGLIHIDVPFALTHSVQVIALPPSDLISSGGVQLHGWGSVSPTMTPEYPDILQTIIKPILPFNTCRLILLLSPLHSTNLCTGPITGGVSACSGDSGGPLVQNGQVIGIVSWGIIPCGTPGAPSVYVRVSAFISWINRIRMDHK